MKSPLRICGIVLAICLCAIVSTARAQSEAFAVGNQEYAAGRFQEAIERYESVARAGQWSASLFYNLGNGWFRLGDSGRAILNYERALALEPRHPETIANLRLVRDAARALELQEQWAERFLAAGDFTQYSVAAALAGWIAVFALAAIFLSRRRRRGAVLLLSLALIVLGLSVFALYSLETGRKSRSLAIVTGQGIEARLATADNAKTVLALPSGSEIKILSKRGDWIYATLPNDLRGWIPASSAEQVRLRVE